MTLNRMYHCAPSAISKIPPMFRLMPAATKNAAANGKTKFAGNEARTCTTGWASRDTRGFIPIHTPIGTQMTLATISSTTTRAKVAAPSSEGVAERAQPDVDVHVVKRPPGPVDHHGADRAEEEHVPGAGPHRRPLQRVLGQAERPGDLVQQPAGRPHRAGHQAGTAERRSRSSTRLRGRSAAADSSVRNRSAQATTGRQNRKLTVMHYDDHDARWRSRRGPGCPARPRRPRRSRSRAARRCGSAR